MSLRTLTPWIILLGSSVAAGSPGLRQLATGGRFPEGPNQQCRDDAGPPWVDDGETAYYVGFSAKPKLLGNGECPLPLRSSCEKKGALAAFHDGPVNCGGKGWFCIITRQKGHRNPEVKANKDGTFPFPDSNFAFCPQNDHDRDGHCHGSDKEDVYGWWVRDHWHRNYAGKVKCCCGWESSAGVANRCDYRKKVTPAVLKNCRDANEEHKVDWHPSCKGDWRSKAPPADQCWEMEGFGPGAGNDAPGNDGGGGGGDKDGDGDENGEGGNGNDAPGNDGGGDGGDKDGDGDENGEGGNGNDAPGNDGGGDGGDKDGDGDENGDEGNDKCNPNRHPGLVCKSGKKFGFGRWNACGRGINKLKGRRYCPVGWAMCANGKCLRSSALCGTAGVKYVEDPCDGDDGNEDEDPTEDGDDGDGNEDEDPKDDGDAEDVCSGLVCNNGNALCTRRRCQKNKKCAVSKSEGVITCASRASTSASDLCRALTRRKNFFTKQWCRTEPACKLMKARGKLRCIGA